MITRDFFKGKRVTVYGLGTNSGGVGTVEFLIKNGVREVIVTDIKTKEDLAPSLTKLSNYKNITFILGQHRPEDFSHVDLVIKNPLIPWTSDYIKIALKSNIPVEMDASIFMALAPKIPIIGVTGTKGKTTTATLLAHILEQAGKKVARVGIGQASVLGKLDSLTKEHIVVFELSSWRLSSLHRVKKSPGFGVVTNIFPDHLNYYKTMESYIHDKEALFAYQKPTDVTLFNAENQETLKMSEHAPGKKFFFSQGEIPLSNIYFRDETIFLSWEGAEEKIVDYAEVKLIGSHNRENVLAALLLSKMLGLSNEAIIRGVKTFPGVEHRLEVVGTVGGVTYINDTAATIPDAAIAGLAAFETPVILLAGGSDKKLPLEKLAQSIGTKAKEVILFKGEGTDRLLPLLKEYFGAREIMVVDTMEGAVLAASRLAKEGDTVLLSPGAASFGLFQNEFDRGMRFKEAVKKLSAVLS